MPMAHNFKTAYFIIPPGIEHGDELLCSFPTCRSAGAKFRYCLHCKVPVAKRNFRNRHKHGNIGGLDKKKSATSGKTPESPSGAEGEQKPRAVESDNKMAEENEGKPLASEATGGVGDNEAKEAAAAADGTVKVSSKQDATKVQEWVKLLENKPDPGDKAAMAVWMMNLMNATEGGDGAPPAMEAVADDAGVKAEEEAAPLEKVEEAPVVATLLDAAAATQADEEAPAVPTVTEKSTPEMEVSGIAKNMSGEGMDMLKEVCGQQPEVRELQQQSEESDVSQPPKKKFKQEYEAPVEEA